MPKSIITSDQIVGCLLFSRLKHKNEQLYSRALGIYENCGKLVFPYQSIPGFTEHGSRHIFEVLQYAGKLVLGIDPDRALEGGELFLLIISILFHDSGLLYHNYAYDDPIKTHQEHASNSEKFIKDNADRLNLSEHEANYIGKICYSHCVTRYYEVAPKKWTIDTLGPCRLHIIMAILRIADLLDLTHSRAPSLIFHIKDLPHENKKHWSRHSIISAVDIDPGNWTITVYAKPLTIKQFESLVKFGGWLNIQMEFVKDDFFSLKLLFSKIDLEIDKSGFSTKVNPVASSNPFIGLYAFPSSKSDLFFGRDYESEIIASLCVKERFFSLVGKSGVGKTSLINAGIIPLLEESGGVCCTFEFSPLTKIVDRLILEICKALKLPPNSNEDTLFEELNKMKNENRFFCLYIDQFEELFTLEFDDYDKGQLRSILKQFIKQTDNFSVVVSIRNEFLINLWQFAEKDPIFFSQDNIYHVSSLGREMAIAAIEKPMMKFLNFTWGDKIVQRIIDDLSDQEPTIYPPYLQLVCRILVNEKFREIRVLSPKERSQNYFIDLDLYERLRGAETIINDYFKTILDGSSPQQRDVIDEILSEMITEYNSKRPILKEKVEEINKGRISNIEEALRKLIESRVVRKVYFGYELEHDLLAKKLINIIHESVKTSTPIREIIVYMKDNLGKEINLEKIAGIARLSKSQVIKRFCTSSNESGQVVS